MPATDLCTKAKHQNFLRQRQLECQHFLNTQMSISLNTLKLHNEKLDDLVDELEQNFGWKPIHPKEDINTIMYRAGQASVIDYIKTKQTDEEI